MSSPETPANLLQFAKALAADAGALALSYVGSSIARLKADRSIVTNADIAVQELIRARIAAKFPDHDFVGEEGARDKGSERQSQYLWIVDPIDGTDTFQRGLPSWAVAIGVLDGSTPLLGVVATPALGDLYWAINGGPAYLDGAPIHVETGEDLGVGTLTLAPSNLHQVARPLMGGRMHAYGSTCFHLACIARGAAHAALLGGSSVWDYFAAGVVLEAAGGALHSLHGDRLDIGALARARTTLPGAIACHPNRLAAVLDGFQVELPREMHGFTGSAAQGRF